MPRDELAVQVFERLKEEYGYKGGDEFWDHWLDCKWCDPFGCGCCAGSCHEAPSV